MQAIQQTGEAFTSGREIIEFFGKLVVGDKFNLEDPLRKRIYEQLFYYFKASPHSTLDTTKGILMIGHLGVGKTDSLRVMNRAFRRFQIANAKRDIEQLYKENRGPEALELYGYRFDQELLIDDAGTEDKDITVYRNTFNPVGEVLLERYDLFKNKKIKTHMTSNLLLKPKEDPAGNAVDKTQDSLRGRYGVRNYDRFIEMFNIIAWPGESLRKNAQ